MPMDFVVSFNQRPGAVLGPTVQSGAYQDRNGIYAHETSSLGGEKEILTNYFKYSIKLTRAHEEKELALFDVVLRLAPSQDHLPFMLGDNLPDVRSLVRSGPTELLSDSGCLDLCHHMSSQPGSEDPSHNAVTQCLAACRPAAHFTERFCAKTPPEPC
ncbi:hypothetical protein P7K49_018010 [Saguinus oedipus]|uniref:Uncharacterized protein n=1 Tax=Saguinus oedipus TaxID=9490 RepID=A0ABQ9V598_SAGOE|nr:hypothetical protein P7K49_018010 [Saguinus oedipus]